MGGAPSPIHALGQRMIDPTRRQLDVLRAVVLKVQADGYPPSVRELMAELGIKSTNGIIDHLSSLTRKGCLVRSTAHSRAMLVTDHGYRVVGVTPRAMRAKTVTLPIVTRFCPIGPVFSSAETSVRVGEGHAHGATFAYRLTTARLAHRGIYAGDLLLMRPGTPDKAGGVVVVFGCQGEDVTDAAIEQVGARAIVAVATGLYREFAEARS